MPYRIKRSEDVADAVRRIAREQVERAINELHDKTLERSKSIHQVRKRCKKIRGLLRLVRPANKELYRAENAFFRDLAAGLAEARDLDVMLETLDALAERFVKEIGDGPFDRIRTALLSGKVDPSVADSDTKGDFERLARTLQESLDRIDDWTISGDGFKALEAGLKKTYRRGLHAMADAYEKKDSEVFHEWRKRVKYQGYHTRLLRSVWKKPMKARRKDLDRLAELLGREHDFAVFHEVLVSKPDSFGKREDITLLLTLVDRRRDLLRAEARPGGERVFAEKPSHFTKRFGIYWKVWRRKLDCFEI